MCYIKTTRRSDQDRSRQTQLKGDQDMNELSKCFAQMLGDERPINSNLPGMQVWESLVMGVNRVLQNKPQHAVKDFLQLAGMTEEQIEDYGY